MTKERAQAYLDIDSNWGWLLKELVDSWPNWEKYESDYLGKVVPKLIADPQLRSPVPTEQRLLRQICDVIGAEELKNLALYISLYRSQPDWEQRWLAEIYEEEEARRLAEEREREQERRAAACREEAHRKILDGLANVLAADFLGADDFYRTRCAEMVTAREYEAMKGDFVLDWAKGRNMKVDPDQVAAMSAIDGHVQVVARAGSGKTSTLVSRAIFLQLHCGVTPKEMLLLAFNRKAADEMRSRLKAVLGNDIPHTMDFHQLAYALVHPEEKLLYDVPDGPQTKSRVMQDLIDEYQQDPEYLPKIRALMLAYFREDWERIVQGGYDKTPEEMLVYRRSMPQLGLDGDYYKSGGEKLIADFLFEYDLNYQYERNFWWNGLNYRPDFTVLTGADSGVAIEYFGLIGDPDYDAQSEAKRSYWRNKPSWHFLELSSHDLAREGPQGFQNLIKQRLVGCGIKCDRLSDDEIWLRIEKRAIDQYTRAVVGFVQRARQSALSPDDLGERVHRHEIASGVEEQFIDLAAAFYRSYLERLQSAGEEDFDGLMQRAAATVVSGQTEFLRSSEAGDLSPNPPITCAQSDGR